MGYTKPIETENAIYVLSLENHALRDYSVFEKYNPDAVVVEGGMRINEPEESEYARNYHLTNIKKLFEKSRKPIYVVDPTLTDWELTKHSAKAPASLIVLLSAIVYLQRKQKKEGKLTRKSFLKAAGLFGLSQVINPSIIDLVGVRKSFPGEINQDFAVNRFIASFEEWNEPLVVRARNAIAAEKMEKSIAPSIKAKLGRKPIIVVQWGASHIGMSDYLRDSNLRRETLRKMGERIRKGLKQSHLDKSLRVEWNEKKSDFDVEEIESNVSTLLGKRTVRKPVEEKVARVSRRGFFGSLLPKSRSSRR